MSKKQLLKPLTTFFIGLVFIGLYVNFALPLLRGEGVLSFVQMLGFWGPVFIVFYIFISHVFAPLIGSPAVIVSLTLYGFPITGLLFFIGSSLSSGVCFYISRRYGRGLVKKLSGEKVLNTVDKLNLSTSSKGVFLARLFGPSVYDIVSYAFGLTKIKFSTYYLTTLFTSLFQYLVMLVLFKDMDFTTSHGLITYYLIMGIVFFIFSIFFGLRKATKK